MTGSSLGCCRRALLKVVSVGVVDADAETASEGVDCASVELVVVDDEEDALDEDEDELVSLSAALSSIDDVVAKALLDVDVVAFDNSGASDECTDAESSRLVSTLTPCARASGRDLIDGIDDALEHVARRTSDTKKR